MARYKILYIHHDGLITGSAISLKNILLKLNKKKFEPIVLICSEGPNRELFESLNVKVLSVKLGTFVTQPPPFFFSRDYYYNIKAWLFKDTKPLEKVLNEIKPHLIHVNDKSALIAGSFAAKLGYKVIWHLRSSFCGKKSLLPYFFSKYKIQKSAKQLIAISEDETDGFKQFPNLSVIYNSIDIDLANELVAKGSNFRQEYKLKADEIAVGMLGNLNQQKGAWNFIKAAGFVVKLAPEINFKFYLITPISNTIGGADSPELIEAKSLIKQEGISDKVIFTGRRNDVLNVMAGLDIVTACYDMNAIGRPALEAAAVGKPIIVNKGHTGKSKMVIDKFTGIVIEKENPNELARAIIYLAKSSETRKQFGENAFNYARENFDSEKNTLKIEAIYETLLNT